VDAGTLKDRHHGVGACEAADARPHRSVRRFARRWDGDAVEDRVPMRADPQLDERQRKPFAGNRQMSMRKSASAASFIARNVVRDERRIVVGPER